MSVFPNKKMDLKQFVEKYGEDFCNAIIKLSDGEECSNELERLVLAEVEGGEVGRFIDAYGEEFFDDLYEFMKRRASMEANRTPYKKGDFIGQKYEVKEVLGMGGFGIVYLVYSHETESVYALKTFRDEYLEDSLTRERFKKEAQVWIDLERHPYIVRAFFVDEISGRLFIATEYIAPNNEGLNTLDAFLRRRPPDLAQSLKWGIQFCHGMEYAYSKGIRAHRDIKPANILIGLGRFRTLKISDFGLAGVIGQAKISGIKLGIQSNKVGFSCQTMEGSGFGTPTYMPPEQFTNAAECDERSDIYSFGIVLFQMATGGKLPFLANLPRNEEEHKQFWHDMYKLHSKAPVPKLDSPLFPIIQKSLEKEPNRRYRSFKDLRADLEPLLKKLTGEVVKLPGSTDMEDWEWGNKGMSLANLGKHQEALACFDKALEINPELPEVWIHKGTTVSILGMHREAIACFDRELAINPRLEKAWILKGLSLQDIGNNQAALVCFDKALEINSSNANTWFGKGSTFHNLGKYQEAIACYDKALAINPSDAEAWNDKGIFFGKLGKYIESITCFDRSIEINPRYTGAWANKANALEYLRKYHEAVACCDKALAINPESPEAWFNKGTSLKSLGMHQEALEAFEHFVSLDLPHNSDPIIKANRIIEKLKAKLSKKSLWKSLFE